MTAAVPLAPGAALRWAVVDRLVAGLAPRRVLEIGCGQGGFGARLAARYDYLGLEPDPTSFAVARGRIEPAGQIRNAPAESLADEGPFDLVCAFEVVEHLADDRAALQSWLTHLRPGGTLLISVPAWPARYGQWDEAVGHYRRYDPAGLDDLLRSVGLTDVRHTLWGWPLTYATERARNVIARRNGPSDGFGTATEGGGADDGEMQARTGASGRLLQPRGLAGALAQAGTVPFSWLQRLRPDAGTGLVGWGRLA